MDEKTKASIFDPFFTTKEVGKGTGLGLAIVYGIIQQHEGFIDVDSEAGNGTTFSIYLPMIESAAKEPESAILSNSGAGTGMILLADDAEDVREPTRIALERAGYKVIEAVDGDDTTNKFMENKDAIRLLILDIKMPKKNGKDAYDAIKKIRPGISAIFMSGYSDDAIHKDDLLKEGLDFISKPILPEELLRKVREALDK